MRHTHNIAQLVCHLLILFLVFYLWWLVLRRRFLHRLGNLGRSTCRARRLLFFLVLLLKFFKHFDCLFVELLIAFDHKLFEG